jgi:hypothetical protein
MICVKVSEQKFERGRVLRRFAAAPWTMIIAWEKAFLPEFVHDSPPIEQVATTILCCLDHQDTKPWSVRKPRSNTNPRRAVVLFVRATGSFTP